ncbi:GNAT family N-acetyltransferase [Nocardia thailandica]|uniref:GNAT family N-acetyltransferase n=1 Tax=Nocardia thailandica TaxID=257275 RepID=UPI0002E60EC4|nr:GNAT family N-acetyltransferase [Nocardia thailandica]
MRIDPLTRERIGELIDLMTDGAPWITARTWSDYWAYATLFSSTCPTAIAEHRLVGAVIAFRSQDDPTEVYIQDVITHPGHRHRGIARALIEALSAQATAWGCRRLYLTSEPGNQAAHATWTALGFTNVAGDHTVGDVSVTTDFKGPGRDRALYQRLTN